MTWPISAISGTKCIKHWRAISIMNTKIGSISVSIQSRPCQDRYRKWPKPIVQQCQCGRSQCGQWRNDNRVCHPGSHYWGAEQYITVPADVQAPSAGTALNEKLDMLSLKFHWFSMILSHFNRLVIRNGHWNSTKSPRTSSVRFWTVIDSSLTKCDIRQHASW